MAGELGDDAKPSLAAGAVNRGADVPERGAGPSRVDPGVERGARRRTRRLRRASTDPDRHGDRRIGVVAIELRGDVERHEFAVPQDSLAGDGVDDLVLDADADRARIAVGEDRTGARARRGERRAASASSSPVLTPGATAALSVSSVLATTRATRRRPRS